MSVDQLPPRRAPRPAADAKLVQYDQFIDKQIQSTRRAVKMVDWATSLVLLAIGVIAFLLAAAVIEHWIIPGGFSTAIRMMLFAVLAGGAGYFAYRRLWPLCKQAINPVYAAQTIEEASPGLKNSLVNLLLFRQHRAEISDAVYHTLEKQAALRLTRVPVDSAVDRTVLIRVGYVLLGVVAVAALYKVLSPKDPWVSAERVLMPWSDIVPASRVSIRSLTPGSVTVSRGEFVTVSAEVRGIHEDDPVLLRFTTDDGQAVDKPIEMKLGRDGLRFEGRLPDKAAADGKLGLSQHVRYRVEAGDARSLDYDIAVVPAPSILVERLDFDYPDYTGFVDRHVEGVGDIRAIEGTKVTIHARANGPVKDAEVDFDADGRRDLTMSHRDADAHATFELQLREDRQTPKHASYVLRFTNQEGRPNRDPVKYPILVEPDRVPEAAILRPQEKSLDIPLNGTVTIEGEARDPDFALSDVRLHGEVAGRPVIDEPLLAAAHTGRFAGRYQFTPSAHKLRAGDVVQYWIVASDNRTPTANTAESDRRLIRIMSPDPAKQPPPDRIAQNDRRQQPPNQQQRDGKRQPNGQPQAGDQQQRGDQQRGDQQKPVDQQQRGDQQQKGDQQQGDQQKQRGDQQGGGGQNSANGKQGEQNEPSGGDSQQQQPGEKNQPGQPGKSGSQSSNDEQTGAGAAGSESPQQGSQPSGARPDANNTARPNNGQRQDGDQQQPKAEPSPVSSEGDNDAEAFDRIQRHMERTGELKHGEPKSSADNQPPSGDAQRSAARPNGPGDQETGRQGDEKSPPNESQQNDSRQADKPKEGETNSGSEQQSKSPDAGTEGQPPKQRDQQAGDNNQQPGQSSDERSEGPGADTKQDDLPDQANEPRDNGDQSKSPGGQQTNSKGPSGAGNEKQSQGSPNAKPEIKPSPKHEQTGSENEETDKQEPPAGANGKRETDSQGEQGGDKPGGGEEGGGQKSPHDGTGSAGQNQSADEGAGESAEKGAGNTSPNAGGDTKASDRTGQTSGETPGRGSKQRDGAGNEPGGAEQRQGDKESGRQGDGKSESQQNNPEFSRDRQGSANQQSEKSDQSGDQQPGEQQKERQTDSAGQQPKPQDGQPGEQGKSGDQSDSNQGNREPGGQQDPQGGGNPTGDGGQTGTAGNAAPSQGTVPEGDAANLDYARKQTDLVLEKLSDQLKRKQIDKDMLERLGWTEEDLRRFVARWQERKSAAQRNDQSGETARRELDDALRSLGLRHGPLQQNAVHDDTQRDMRQGFRGPVPLEYQERLRAYNRGVSRAGPDGE